MIYASCPLRISLFGGSSDNPYYVEKNGYGSVISFTCDLKIDMKYVWDWAKIILLQESMYE